jgi:hypothetical protein
MITKMRVSSPPSGKIDNHCVCSKRTRVSLVRRTSMFIALVAEK